MNREEFEDFKTSGLFAISDKMKEIEIISRTPMDFENVTESKIAITKIRDKANEMLALYTEIAFAEMDIKEED